MGAQDPKVPQPAPKAQESYTYQEGKGIDKVGEIIEKSDKKEVLSAAFKLFNLSVDTKLGSFANSTEKDKVKLVMWNIVRDKLGIKGAFMSGLQKMKSTLSEFTKAFSLKDNESLADESLSSENASKLKAYANIKNGMVGTPAGDLLDYIESSIPGMGLLDRISKNQEHKERLLSNPEAFEELMKNGIDKTEKSGEVSDQDITAYLDRKVNKLGEGEYTKYLSKTVDKTKKSGGTLSTFKKVVDKIMGLADKFGMKDSLVSMLEMVYKIPGIGPILQALFAPQIAGSLDKWGVNGEKAKSTALFHELYGSLGDKAKDALGFDPVPREAQAPTKEKPAVEANLNGIEAKELEGFYTAIATYNEAINAEDRDLDDPVLKGREEIDIGAHSFWSGILLGKKVGKDAGDLDNNNVLKIIHESLGGTKALKEMAKKDDFLGALNTVTSNGGIITLLEGERAKTQTVAGEEKVREQEIKKEEEKVKEVTEFTSGLNSFIGENKAVFNIAPSEGDFTNEELADIFAKVNDYNATAHPDAPRIHKKSAEFWESITTGKINGRELVEIAPESEKITKGNVYFQVHKQLRGDKKGELRFNSKTEFTTALKSVSFFAAEKRAVELKEKKAGGDAVKEATVAVDTAEDTAKAKEVRDAMAAAVTGAAKVKRNVEMAEATTIPYESQEAISTSGISKVSPTGITISGVEYEWTDGDSKSVSNIEEMQYQEGGKIITLIDKKGVEYDVLVPDTVFPNTVYPNEAFIFNEMTAGPVRKPLSLGRKIGLGLKKVIKTGQTL